MSSADWTEILLYIACLLLISPFLGGYCYAVYTGKPTFLSPVLGWLERLIYQLAGIDSQEEMGWVRYAKTLLIFNGLGMFLLFLIQIFQHLLPFNPQNFPAVTPWMAFNTAASFVTNTDWQFYAPETTLSYFSQMAGMTVQNFLSAGTGMAVGVAVMRGFISKGSFTIGNFWVDLVRSILYILLPLSFILALLLVTQGVVATLQPYVVAHTLEGELQTIPLGPAASQVAIKQLGSNGGGFFYANSAHPFENPTRLSNFLEVLSVLLISAAFPFIFGCMVRKKGLGWMLFLIMLSLWGASFFSARYFESQPNPILGPRSWLEGKEQRLGMTRSILWFTAITASANGSTNAAQGSIAPISGAISLFNMMHREVAFGPVGAGLCSLLMFCLLSSVLAGALIGKSPQFASKRIGKTELQWIFVSILLSAGLALLGASLTCLIPIARKVLEARGPHAFSQLLYIFISSTVNNGSSFSGTKFNLAYYDIILSLTMILGRCAILIPALALAGSVAEKRIESAKSYRNYQDSFTFAFLIFVIVSIIAVLIYLPVLFLGPILEHLLMLRRITFEP